MHISNWGWTNHEFHKKGFVQNKTLRNKESYPEIYVVLQLTVNAYFNSAYGSTKHTKQNSRSIEEFLIGHMYHNDSYQQK